MHQYETEACFALLAAIVRRWWLDALSQTGELPGLSRFLDVPESDLCTRRPFVFKRWR